jgi:hypothetical protein
MRLALDFVQFDKYKTCVLWPELKNADWLIDLGNWSFSTIPKLANPDFIEIPQDFFNYKRSLIEHVFDDPLLL